MREEHAVHPVYRAILGVTAITGPETGVVQREIAPVQALERWDEAHAEVVAQAERRAAGLDELLEELPRGPEAHAEVEQPAAGIPFEQDAVAADLTRGAAVDGDRKAARWHAGKGTSYARATFATVSQCGSSAPVDGKGQRRAIPPMILSHPNDHDNRSFSSSSALAASARAPAWERLAGPESTPESR